MMSAESSSQARSVTAADPLQRLTAEIARGGFVTAVGMLIGTAALILWRRLAGAISEPLPTAALLGTGVLICALAAGARVAHRRLVGAAVGPAAWAVALLPSTAVLALGLLVSLPGTAPEGLTGFWTLLVAEECWAWWPMLRRVRRPPAVPSPGLPHPLPAAQTATIHAPTCSSEQQIRPEDVLQQLTRGQAADGSEQLTGWLRVPFAPGQRIGSVHVAFCPPFPQTPEITVEQLAGPGARIKTAQVLPYGARLELKRLADAEKPASVVLRFAARTS